MSSRDYDRGRFGESEESKFPIKLTPENLYRGLLLGIIAITLLWLPFALFQRNSSGVYQVRQPWWGGDLTVRTTPGVYWQGNGVITDYNAATSLKFTDEAGEENVTGHPILVRFNDGGRAKVYVECTFLLSAATDDMAKLHVIFGHQDLLEEELFMPMVTESVVMSASLMTSEESYTTLRSQFSDWVADQISNGVFITESDKREIPVQKKGGRPAFQYFVDIKRDSLGHPVRKEKVISEYGVTVGQCVISKIIYLDDLDKLIDKKRDYLSRVVSAKSAAQRAVQETITAEASGQKDVEVARYSELESAQKTAALYDNMKRQALIEAENAVTVARAELDAAKSKKQQLIAEGTGMAQKRALSMRASGAIGTKKTYFLEVIGAYEEAFSGKRLAPRVTVAGQKMPNGFELLSAIKAQLASELKININDLRSR